MAKLHAVGKGGKRQGAGRKRTLAEPTVPIRVPKSLAAWIKENLDKIAKLKDSGN